MAEFSNHVGCNLIIITSALINCPDGQKESMRWMERKKEDLIKHTTFPGSSGSRLLHINCCSLTPTIIYNIPEIGYFLTSYHNRTYQLPLCVSCALGKWHCVCTGGTESAVCQQQLSAACKAFRDTTYCRSSMFLIAHRAQLTYKNNMI